MTNNLFLGISIGAFLTSSFKSSLDFSNKSITQLQDSIKKIKNNPVNFTTTGMADGALREINKIKTEIAKLKLASRISLKIDAVKSDLEKEKSGAIALAGTGFLLSKPIASFDAVEQRKGQMASLGTSERGISLLQKSAEESTKKTGEFTTEEILASSYDLKSGISSLSDEMLAKYQKTTVAMASATKGSMSSAVNTVTLGYGIFRTQFKNDEEFVTKFTAGIAKTVQLYKTTGDDLSAGLTNLGTTATMLKVPMQEQLAVIGTAKSAYGSASEASTGYKSMLVGLGGAQKDLGLKFVDTHGHMLPMSNILEKIQKKYGDLSKVSDQIKLKKAFGSDEAVKFLGVMIANKQGLEGQKEINVEMGKGTQLIEKMSQSMQRGRGVEIMNNNLSVLSGRIGKVFSPAIDLATNSIGWMADKLITAIDKFPKTASVLGGVSMGVFGVALAFKAFTVGKLAFSLLGLTVKLATLTKGFFFVGRAILWMGRALLLNPVGLAITAIAVGAYLIYRNWGTLKPYFTTLWNGIKSVFNFAKKWIVSYITDPIGTIKTVWNNLFAWFEGKFSAIGKTLKGLTPNGILKSIATLGIDAPAIPKFPNAPKPTALVPSAPRRVNVPALKKGNTKHQTNHVSVVINNPSVKNKEDVNAINTHVEQAVKRALRQERENQENRSIKGGG